MHRITTITLTAIAGFVDTATFVGVHGLFAAHVTGNFVVFGAALAKGVHEEDYLKLIAFPVFMFAVMVGVTIFSLSKSKRFGGVSLLLAVQALLLAVVAACFYAIPAQIPLSYLALTLVAAMGLQNSLHRYVAGPMTTVMTGTVMNWSAAMAEKLFRLPVPEGKSSKAQPFVAAFAGGCVAAGFMDQLLGLSSVIIPAFCLLCLAAFEFKIAKEKTA